VRATSATDWRKAEMVFFGWVGRGGDALCAAQSKAGRMEEVEF
jgi:hypothetical protein